MSFGRRSLVADSAVIFVPQAWPNIGIQYCTVGGFPHNHPPQFETNITINICPSDPIF